MSDQSPIVLVGFMGAGKSTVGRILAHRWGRHFLDLDQLVALTSGRVAAEHIAGRGEESFRRAESRALSQAMATRNTIIATGGGAVLSRRNRNLMQRSGTPVVWLRVSAGVAQSRVAGKSEHRPLMPGDLAAALELKRVREDLYRSVATVAVNTDSLDPDRVADEVTSSLVLEGPASEPADQAARLLLIEGEELPDGHGPVAVGRGFLERLPDLPGFPADVSGPVLVVSEPLAYSLFGSVLVRGLEKAGLDPRVHLLPTGESAKSIRGLTGAWEAARDVGLERGGLVVTLGGGAVTDVGGLVAATYVRGVRVVQVPTTLLAQVDAAIGGKTGINLAGAKNMVGCFHLPSLVVADGDVLRPLPRSLTAEGLIEGAKALIVDGRPPDATRSLADQGGMAFVAGAVRAKLSLIRGDLRERGRREFLNFGHSFGHALESAAGLGRIRHGLAVGVGCLAALDLSRGLGFLSEAEADGVRTVFGDLVAGFPATERRRLAGIAPEAVLTWLSADKKRRGGRSRLICLRSARSTGSGAAPALLAPVIVTDPEPDLVHASLVSALKRVGDAVCLERSG